MISNIRLSLRSLRAFAAVVEHGSITAAAKVLSIAPSAVAAAVDQVEAEFGSILLIRTRARGISPTPAGLDMAARFRTLLEDYAGVMEEGRDIAQTLSGTLRVGYYAPVAPAFLPRILHPMMQDNPDLKVELRTHDNDSVQEALLSGRIDVIIFASQDVRSGIETRVLLDLPPYVLAPKGHAITTRSSVSLKEVSEYPIIRLDRPIARPYLSQLFRSQALSPDIVAEADSTEMVRGLVGAGIGLAVLNMRPCTNQSYGGDTLCAVPLEPGLPSLQLLSGSAQGRQRRLVNSFLETLHDWMDTKSARALTIT